MKKRTIILLEAGLLLGVFCSIFLVPRDLPVRTFVLIAVSVVVIANILIFSKPKQSGVSAPYRMTAQAWFALGLMVLYWVLYFLWR